MAMMMGSAMFSSSLPMGMVPILFPPGVICFDIMIPLEIAHILFYFILYIRIMQESISER